MDTQTVLFLITAGLSIAAAWPLVRRASKDYRAMTDEERDENGTW